MAGLIAYIGMGTVMVPECADMYWSAGVLVSLLELQVDELAWLLPQRRALASAQMQLSGNQTSFWGAQQPDQRNRIF